VTETISKLHSSERLPPGSSEKIILDLGCGVGLFSVWMAAALGGVRTKLKMILNRIEQESRKEKIRGGLNS
jgi:2-polyprenyl-3-methyl-5-hydroxy-6-metoxy-1,4-benzoquinol methylase